MYSFIDHIKNQLTKLPGSHAQLKMAPEGRHKHMEAPHNARLGGVMILLFEIDKKWNTLLIRRTEDGHVHSGQISFPGGQKEVGDTDIMFTACRECEEEVGIKKKDIEILGTLSPLYIPPSNFYVTPTLGYIQNVQHLKASEKEVQEIIQTPLELLFHPDIKQTRTVKPNYESPVYALADDILIWGATAMMISELEYIAKQPI